MRLVLTLGRYGKAVRYQDGYKSQWDWLMDAHPDLLEGSPRSYLTWETVDPEDRPPDIFDGTTTIHTGPDTPTHVLLPVIPGGA
jgi:hypothetical protein